MDTRESMMQNPEKRKRAPGAGVKADDGVTGLERKQVRLDADTEALLFQVGGNNLSLGIREAARRLIEHADTEPFNKKRHESRNQY